VPVRRGLPLWRPRPHSGCISPPWERWDVM